MSDLARHNVYRISPRFLDHASTQPNVRPRISATTATLSILTACAVLGVLPPARADDPAPAKRSAHVTKPPARIAPAPAPVYDSLTLVDWLRRLGFGEGGSDSFGDASFALTAPVPVAEVDVPAFSGASAAPDAPRGSILAASRLQPQAAGQTAYVDTTDPGVSGETYLGATYTVPSGGDAFSNLFVGYNKTGTASQSSGTLTIGSNLYLGYNAGSSGTYTLGGGTLITPDVLGGSGTSTFNFKGGTLQPTSSNGTSFFPNVLTSAKVLAGGAKINTNGFNVTIAQPLLNGVSGTDGGLTKSGTGTLTLTGANTYTGATTINGGTLQLGSGSTTGSLSTSSAITDNGNLTFNRSNPVTQGTDFSSAAIGGSGSVTQAGSGTTTFNVSNAYAGGTSVTAGRLVELTVGGAFANGTVSISSGAVVELQNTTSQDAGTFTGAGTLQKTGTSAASFGGGSGTVNIALSPGGLLDVQAGSLAGSSSGQGSFTNNKGSLNIASGALFDGVEGTIIVDALTGAGTLRGGFFNTGSTTIGVANGSGAFSGTIQNSIYGSTSLLNLIKTGTGTETLSGANVYTGTTTVNGGTLQAGVASVAGTSGAFGLNSAVTLANVAGATLDLNGFSTQIGSLTGGGATGGNVTLGSATLSVGGDNTSPDAYAGAISGRGGLTKIGTGTLALSGANTYTGPTMVNAGTLLVNGSSSGTGAVTVQNSGSVLGGTGTISAPVSVTTGTLNPGNNAGADGSVDDVGKLTVGALTLSSTATSVFDLNSGTIYDQVQVNGNIALGGSTLTLNVPTANQTFTAGQVLDLFHSTGTLSGTFSDFADGSSYTYGNETFHANYTTTDFTLTALTSVPEPATWLSGALLIGATALSLRHRVISAQGMVRP